MVGPPFQACFLAPRDGIYVMHVELNPVLLLLSGLLVVLLSVAFVRRVGLAGWLVLGAILLLCAGTNPGTADHVGAVQRQARAAPAHGASMDSSRGLMTQFKSGAFEPLADYHNLGIASVTSIQGKILSFGVFGQVWVANLQRLAYRPAPDVVGYRGLGHLAGS